jgi:hypothetical protein
VAGATFRQGVWARWLLHLVPPPEDPAHPEYAYRTVGGMYVWSSACRSLTTGPPRNPVAWSQHPQMRLCRKCLIWAIEQEKARK